MGARPVEKLLASAVLLPILAIAISHEAASQGACPYLTRPLTERPKTELDSPAVVRLNTYSPGAWVCYQGTMKLCQSSGSWKSMGSCSDYQQAPDACAVEGSDPKLCGASGTPDSLDASNRNFSTAAPGSGQPPGAEWPDLSQPGAGFGWRGIDIPDPWNAPSQPPGLSQPGAVGGGSVGGIGVGPPSALQPGAIGSSPASLGSVPGDFRFVPPGGVLPPLSNVPNTAGSSTSPRGGQQAGSTSTGTTAGGSCFNMEQQVNQRMSNLSTRSGQGGLCTSYREMEQALNLIEPLLNQCPSADPSGELKRNIQENRRIVAEGKKVCVPVETIETYACESPTGRCAGPANSQSLAAKPSNPAPPVGAGTGSPASRPVGNADHSFGSR
jgi:hypothetical protein